MFRFVLALVLLLSLSGIASAACPGVICGGQQVVVAQSFGVPVQTFAVAQPIFVGGLPVTFAQSVPLPFAVAVPTQTIVNQQFGFFGRLRSQSVTQINGFQQVSFVGGVPVQFGFGNVTQVNRFGPFGGLRSSRTFVGF